MLTKIMPKDLPSILVNTADDPILDMEGVREELARMGFRATEDMVRRWAGKRVFPVFKLGRRLVITRRSLHDRIDALQKEAEKVLHRRSAERPRRRNARARK